MEALSPSLPIRAMIAADTTGREPIWSSGQQLATNAFLADRTLAR